MILTFHCEGEVYFMLFFLFFFISLYYISHNLEIYTIRSILIWYFETLNDTAIIATLKGKGNPFFFPLRNCNSRKLAKMSPK